MWDVTGSQILTPQSSLYLGFNSVIVAHITLVSCDLINLCLFTSTSREWTFLLAAVPDLKGPSVIVLSGHRYSTSLTVTLPNILVNVVSSDHRAYCKGFCFWCHCLCMTRWLLKGSCSLITKGIRRYNNRRYYCWARKLMPCKNWALHTIWHIRHLPTLYVPYYSYIALTVML